MMAHRGLCDEAHGVEPPDGRYTTGTAGGTTADPADRVTLDESVNVWSQQDGITVTDYAFAVAGGRITHIWAMRNPEKLRPWTTG